MHSQKRIKVCFILPEKAEDTATHFAHKWEMMQELKNDINFFVYAPIGFDIFRIFFTRFRGCRTYYVHYSFRGALLALFITRFLGGKVFYWNCGIPWLYKRGRLEEWIFRFILQHSIFVTGTDRLAEEYAAQYKLQRSHICVVPNYIRVSRMQNIKKDDARAKLGIPKDTKVILFLHHLSRRKGAHLLPEIIKKFKDRHNIIFLVVGDGLEQSAVESRIMNYELWNLVRMEGSIPNYRVPEYIAAADVYLMPSEEEGMPNALLEAFATGVPFVASDVGGVKEMTPAVLHEYILPYGNVVQFAGKIKKLLGDKELRERISIVEKEWVRRYDVAVVAPMFLELLQE